MADEYALYKGEELLDVGTSEEIAKRRGVKLTTILYYQSHTYQERNHGGNCLQLIKLEDEDE